MDNIVSRVGREERAANLKSFSDFNKLDRNEYARRLLNIYVPIAANDPDYAVTKWGDNLKLTKVFAYIENNSDIIAATPENVIKYVGMEDELEQYRHYQKELKGKDFEQAQKVLRAEFERSGRQMAEALAQSVSQQHVEKIGAGTAALWGRIKSSVTNYLRQKGYIFYSSKPAVTGEEREDVKPEKGRFLTMLLADPFALYRNKQYISWELFEENTLELTEFIDRLYHMNALTLGIASYCEEGLNRHRELFKKKKQPESLKNSLVVPKPHDFLSELMKIDKGLVNGQGKALEGGRHGRKK